jgi:hypothetical protein
MRDRKWVHIRQFITALGLLVGVFGVAVRAQAIPVTTELILNGGFESGFTNWGGNDSGSGNWFIQDGSIDPNGPLLAGGVISGTQSAETFSSGPGSKALWQSFTLPTNITLATVSWTDRMWNYASDYSATQEFVASIFNDITLFSTQPGDPLIGAWGNRSIDITAWAQANEGNTRFLYFWQEDTQGFMNVFLDDVSLQVTTIPEPSTALLLGLGLSGLATRRRRRS